MSQMIEKVVLITGASQGIGAECARVFAAAGARVALLARNQAAIENLAAEIGPNAVAIRCDVSDYSDVQAAVAATLDQFGRLDVVINNAGVIEPISHLATSDADAWGRAIDINLKGVFHVLRAALPVMQAAGGGTVLAVSSGAAHGPVEAWSAYCASKAGAAMLTACVDKEARDLGIRAMALSPGTVATDMQHKIKASAINPVSRIDWSDHIPPDWPARTLLWMCSADADEFIGQEIRLRAELIRRRAGLID
jgi:NAD(P)-dependent dehydrogenase (short-subunit alcohol dehydrogenase family)